MKVIQWLGLVLVCCSLAPVGCQRQPSKDNTNQKGTHTGSGSSSGDPHGTGGSVSDADTKAALAKLSSEDRALAEAQKKCPVSEEPLGSMGTPVNITVKGQPVFLCCSSCNAKALAHADRTLDKVKQFKKAKAAGSGE
jgi:hypothetical protein